MGYRNIEPHMLQIVPLAQSCGLFTSDTELSSGYGCLSLSKGKLERGRCFDFDCPLANIASLEDMKKFDKDLYEEYREECEKEGLEPQDFGSEWMVQYREVV